MTTQDFLVELGTEELPPKNLKKLGLSFKDSITKSLADAKLGYSELQWFAAPRRLAVLVKDLQQSQDDIVEEKLGPNVKAAFDADGNPTKAAQGFARGLGVEVSELGRKETTKGEQLAYSQSIKGRASVELLPEFIGSALKNLPIAKRMRWGASRTEFVRPVQWLVMLNGSDVIDCEILGKQAGNQSRGHRFMCKEALTIDCAGNYPSIMLEQGKVVADYQQRQQIIVEEVQKQADILGAHAVVEPSLLDEVTGLVEWPVALTGKFEDSFLAIPREALISSMAEHQKYFHVVDNNGDLKPNFIFMSNLVSKDPSQIIDGNERVIRPRLSDADFFFKTDLKSNQEERCQRLKPVVFQAKLGSVWDKTQRIAALAATISKLIGGNPADAERAGQLCKADLVSDMVSEFSDMQGIAGYHYALADGENNEVAMAMVEQYLPKGASAALPTTLTGNAVALADRLDTLVGIFGINQPPTGSKDPFALRRAALGVIRIIEEGRFVNIDLNQLIEQAVVGYGDKLANQATASDVIHFIFDRYRAIYQDAGISTETVIAVQNVLQQAGQIHNPADFALRVAAVESFRSMEAADALASANKRIKNILAKQQGNPASSVDLALLSDASETALNQQLNALAEQVPALCSQRDYTAALALLAGLKDSVDNFFESVMVMDEDQAVRANRLSLLSQLIGLFGQIADISELQA
ncbi:Glycine--tRNA ligase beta subunit [Sinobacterium norvegicum]|uniref:Glycine--tRNA ligase beta subunit n=1 Tax=Sinobacterium norvegicum TaxID=1641715 RepID=A0ABM9AIX1_9GAMM|nr:glycine--tRNA ligase subunit beta [Sinobacterium norvegicum]CAH0993013.1 Glycine--tRNA ligase beta subunit [Sinobacterium norvegicum]